jgi:hypothetical protein
MRRRYNTSLISEIPSESVLATGTSPPISKLNNITLIVIPLVCVLALCAVAGFAGICILLKLSLIWKQQNERSVATEVNQTNYEDIHPVYETIPSTKSEKFTQGNFGITMMSNEAYVSSEKVILSMQNNSSYLSASQFMTFTRATVTESGGPTKKHLPVGQVSVMTNS